MESKSQKKQILLNICVVLGISLVMVLGMEYTLHNDWNAVVQWMINHPGYVFLTVLFVSGVYYFLIQLILFIPATIIITLLSYVWSAVNYLKYTMRNEYVIGNDVELVFQGQMSFKQEDVRIRKKKLIYPPNPLNFLFPSSVLFFS